MKIKMLILILASFFIFSFCRSYIIHMDIFSVKDFSATTWLMILKFGTKLDSNELYCVTKKKPHIAHQFLYLFIFFLSNGNFCHRFLFSYWSQCFQILCTPSSRQSVSCKWKLRCLSLFCLLFQFFIFSFCHSYIVYLDIFSVKDFSASTWHRILKFGAKLDSDKVYCVAKTATYSISVPLFVQFSSSQVIISSIDFSACIGASAFKFYVHL